MYNWVDLNAIIRLLEINLGQAAPVVGKTVPAVGKEVLWLRQVHKFKVLSKSVFNSINHRLGKRSEDRASKKIQMVPKFSARSEPP